MSAFCAFVLVGTAQERVEPTTLTIGRRLRLVVVVVVVASAATATAAVAAATAA